LLAAITACRSTRGKATTKSLSLQRRWSAAHLDRTLQPAKALPRPDPNQISRTAAQPCCSHQPDAPLLLLYLRRPPPFASNRSPPRDRRCNLQQSEQQPPPEAPLPPPERPLSRICALLPGVSADADLPNAGPARPDSSFPAVLLPPPVHPWPEPPLPSRFAVSLGDPRALPGKEGKNRKKKQKQKEKKI